MYVCIDERKVKFCTVTTAILNTIFNTSTTTPTTSTTSTTTTKKMNEPLGRSLQVGKQDSTTSEATRSRGLTY
jgi:hypothetical protein